jgi:hypothetical protein
MLVIRSECYSTAIRDDLTISLTVSSMVNISSTIWAVRSKILAQWGSTRMAVEVEGLRRFVEHHCVTVLFFQLPQALTN